MPGLPVVFFILALIAVATAIGTILSRNAIYAAMLLVLNFATIAMLYLILGAPFIALSQITVYAGSIMVLFLFVIMLLGAERLQRGGGAIRGHAFVAISLALILVATFVYYLFLRMGDLTSIAELPANYGAPEAIGQLLFSRYMLPFEVTAVILLAAVVGSIILAKPDQPSPGRMARGISTETHAPAGAQEEAARNDAARNQAAQISEAALTESDAK